MSVGEIQTSARLTQRVRGGMSDAEMRGEAMGECKDECADHVQELLKQIEQLKAENQAFGNVLAVIHGDGGHYITKHGHDKASKDAIRIVLDLGAELNSANHDYAELTKERTDYVAENKRLRDALQSLHDVQNGPPLIRRKDQWQAAYDEAEALLDED